MHNMKIKWRPSSSVSENVHQLRKPRDSHVRESTGKEWQAKPAVNAPVLCHLWIPS